MKGINLKEKYSKFMGSVFINSNNEDDFVVINGFDRDRLAIYSKSKCLDYKIPIKEFDEYFRLAKYELKVVVSTNYCMDINKKESFYYFDDVHMLGHKINNIMLGNLDITNLIKDGNILTYKMDSLDFIKHIKINNKELGQVFIIITKLTD